MYTTTDDLIEALKKYPKGTPLLGLASGFTKEYQRKGLTITNVVSVQGSYPDDGPLNNVAVFFWPKEMKNDDILGRVQPTGKEET